jgi:hypothetical protein
MKKLIAVFILLAGCSLFTATRIVEQTENKIVVNAWGNTRYEAESAAFKKAEEVFGKVKEFRPAECNQEYRDNSMGPGGCTFWSCNVFAERIK